MSEMPEYHPLESLCCSCLFRTLRDDEEDTRKQRALKRITELERKIDELEIALQHWKFKNGYFLWSGSSCCKPIVVATSFSQQSE